ncbi:MAG TPA: hypothetical protein VFB29_14825 [Pseudolabrys sp.]|nr:hypothetical protein [Pseudolabrys sp.]
MSIFDLKNRVAFIADGDSGIGLDMAEGLAGAGTSITDASFRLRHRHGDRRRRWVLGAGLTGQQRLNGNLAEEVLDLEA